MRKYSDYFLTEKKKRKKKGSSLTPEEMSLVEWTKFTIVVPTEKDKIELRKAFRHIHNANINTNNIVVNQLAHEYLEAPDIVVSGELYLSIPKAEPTDEV